MSLCKSLLYWAGLLAQNIKAQPAPGSQLIRYNIRPQRCFGDFEAIEVYAHLHCPVVDLPADDFSDVFYSSISGENLHIVKIGFLIGGEAVQKLALHLIVVHDVKATGGVQFHETQYLQSMVVFLLPVTVKAVAHLEKEMRTVFYYIASAVSVHVQNIQ